YESELRGQAGAGRAHAPCKPRHRGRVGGARAHRPRGGARMKPFKVVTAIAAPLLRANVDTDAIIPSREMKRVSKDGFAEGLFAGWRYTCPGSREPRPDFVLNRPPFDRACILLAGSNFGC